MNFEQEFPLCYLINLGRREDRRIASENRLESAGIAFERFPAVDQRWVRRERGYESAGRYALALTQRLAVRRAKKRGAKAVLLFEDDVVLHPEFRAMVQCLDLPDDWGILYFGCAHISRPAPVGRGLVRCSFGLDTHAFAVRDRYFDRVISALAGIPGQKTGEVPASDWILAQLHGEIPAYAAFPNLAWQEASTSDLLHRYCTNYTEHGTQRHGHQAIVGLAAEVLGHKPYRLSMVSGSEEVPCVHPAFLFLTRGDHHLPSIWQEYLPEDPSSCNVYCHPKRPEEVNSAFLKSNIIPENVPTEWGNVSLVRATLMLIRNALRNPAHSHFILLSESCVPVKPFADLQRLLSLDGRSIISHSTREELENSEPRKVTRLDRNPMIPRDSIIFQTQWMILSREAAELVAEDDFTTEFEGTFAPDECYFMTVLRMKGYPINEKVRNFNATWNSWPDGAGHPATYDHVDGRLAAALFASPSPFARKFAPSSNIGSFGLHLAHDPIRVNGLAH